MRDRKGEGGRERKGERERGRKGEGGRGREGGREREGGGECVLCAHNKFTKKNNKNLTIKHFTFLYFSTLITNF